MKATSGQTAVAKDNLVLQTPGMNLWMFLHRWFNVIPPYSCCHLILMCMAISGFKSEWGIRHGSTSQLISISCKLVHFGPLPIPTQIPECSVRRYILCLYPLHLTGHSLTWPLCGSPHHPDKLQLCTDKQLAGEQEAQSVHVCNVERQLTK